MTFHDKIKKNREAFLEYNKAKFQRFQEHIGKAKIDKVINSIPLLLCLNHKKVPGYIEGKVPYGIISYEPDEEIKKYMKNRFHLTSLEINNPDPFIEMVAVMGSVGTIAYTKKSDFDYWVCIDKRKHSPDMIDNFQKKIDEIQHWAMKEVDVEVHLFVNDIESIKNNIFAEDEEEAFGSTTRAVLKDEFYRSSIIIAGKIPFWWVIPRFINDSEYEKLYNRLTDDMKDEMFVDLGNLLKISKEDFLGAALFQLIKSLGNPFKSIIKIGVLEKYLFGPDDSPLLCQKLKSNILRGNLDTKIIDSYLLMFEEVYNYYESVIDEKKLLNILRQNLYLKIDPQLSKYIHMPKKNLPYKIMMMFKYVTEWGWSEKDIRELDDFDNWDYNKIMVFWNLVKTFMRLSYQRITTQLPKTNLAQIISESDYMLLSRKIQTNFSSKENKIDNYVTFKDTPYESILYIEPINKDINQQEWNLYKRNTSSKDKFISTTLKAEKDLVKLIAWTSINQIFNPTFSRMKIQSGYNRINQNQVVELLTKISNLFSGKNIQLRNDYFLNPAFNLLNIIILNFNIEMADTIQTIHHLYQTSWGESYLDEYTSEEDLIKIFSKILSDGIKLKRNFDEYCIIVSPEPFKKYYKNIETLFKGVYEFIIQSNPNSSLRIVTHIVDNYIAVSRDGDKITIHSDPNIIKMLSTITLRPKKDVIHKFYGDDVHLPILNEIYKMRQPNSISIVYEEKGEKIFIYIINERGNIFTSIKSKKYKEEIIIYSYCFCRNAIIHINDYHYLPDINDSISVYKLSIDKFGKHSFENESRWVEEIYFIKYKSDKSLVATISRYSGEETLYSINYNDSSPSNFIPLIQIPEILIQLRNEKFLLNYPISDIVFTDFKEKDISFGSTLYLLEKYRLEFIIDKTLK